eukprot:CAMPEP_0197667336 /NCGR_PEP_ID=MMETSP1338-20131121/65949_1 /TAXON_ID=43686 ORGANISM="Pelagodinium beii, Strain RCC1491" /NCGR_SAMPLE_ID=MMETSP1338 /ASSEMBLY_ACC=CAM_ASM_000754 /LENGTH=393 /DNA_ID=CAMNT_0043246553 /DNA_START=17 /DNA_END=1198 /DNA_ORIENTATION=+
MASLPGYSEIGEDESAGNSASSSSMLPVVKTSAQSGSLYRKVACATLAVTGLATVALAVSSHFRLFTSSAHGDLRGSAGNSRAGHDRGTVSMVDDSIETLTPPKAPLKEFYMYRVQSVEDYEPENQDMANVGGALWYLHNEIIWHHWIRAGTYSSTPKTRIERFHVKTRATDKLFERDMNFGVVNAYDLGKCTGPFGCENLEYYGPVVGCETWDKQQEQNNFPHTQWIGENVYPGARWYSLPGHCSSRQFWDQTEDCIKDEPGGSCPPGVLPTGQFDCTYSYEKAGQINISDLEGIDSFDEFIESGGEEYSRRSDKGTKMHFWDGRDNTTLCQRRIDAVLQLFKKQYPLMPDLPDPECDFDIHKFYPQFPLGVFDEPSTTTTTTTEEDKKKKD